MYHEDRVCFLCGKNGTQDPKGLEEHHIFNGVGLRKKCERYGLTVYLCGIEHHNGGPDSVHRNQDVDRKVKQYGQRKAMEENGWTVQDFVVEFGKNYLDEEDEPEEPEEPGTVERYERMAAELAARRRRIPGVPEDCFAGMA